MITARILKAAHVAAVWHAKQRRKGSAQEPYVNHLLEVAYLVAESPEGRNDENLIIAALLHDAIEDAKIPYACIAEMFGADVADLVQEVTDDKALAKQERKRLQIVNAPHKSQRAALLKLADKTSNLRAVANDPPVHWPLERRREYVRWARAVVDALPPASPWLRQKFEEAAAEAESKLELGNALDCTR